MLGNPGSLLALTSGRPRLITRNSTDSRASFQFEAGSPYFPLQFVSRGLSGSVQPQCIRHAGPQRHGEIRRLFEAGTADTLLQVGRRDTHDESFQHLRFFDAKL